MAFSELSPGRPILFVEIGNNIIKLCLLEKHTFPLFINDVCKVVDKKYRSMSFPKHKWLHCAAARALSMYYPSHSSQCKIQRL